MWPVVNSTLMSDDLHHGVVAGGHLLILGSIFLPELHTRAVHGEAGATENSDNLFSDEEGNPAEARGQIGRC